MWASAPTANDPLRSKRSNKVSNIVRSIKTLTTKEIGKPIFQRSFYDHIIRNVQDYNETWEYIENNPKMWILNKKRKVSNISSPIVGDDAHIVPNSTFMGEKQKISKP